MSLKHLYKGISIILLCLAFSMVYAQQQNKETLDDVSQRVKVLEGQKENLDGRFNNKSDALDLKFEKLEKELKDDYDHLEILLWIFGPITILSIIAYIIRLFKLYNLVQETADKKINEKFDSLLDDKKSNIIEIIEKHDIETQLKKTKKILVLTPNGADDSFVKKFFGDQVMGFNRELVFYATPDELKKKNKVDLVFFNDEKQPFGQEKIIEIMRKAGKNNVFFYFGQNHLDLKDDKYKDLKDRVNFANARAQIYGNLIDTLRYQKLLQ